MGRWSFTRTGRSTAPVDQVWSLLGEAHRWQEWSFLDRSVLEHEGDPAPDGVGAVRSFTRFGVGSKEEVVEWDPPTHLAYTILKGFPVRHYRADIMLAPALGTGGAPSSTGTTLTWSVTFDARYPGTGAVLRVVLGIIISRFAGAVCRYADHRASGGSGASEATPG
jgi:uncharacterized protein YndB with AHSA1/START domain